MLKVNSSKKKGFTLIELLVVIAIIGILSAVVLVSLNESRARARDARRMSDIREISKALELYMLEHGVYPTYVASSNGVGGAPSGWPQLRTALASYIDLPEDPVGTTQYHYVYHGGDSICGAKTNAYIITIRRLESMRSQSNNPCNGNYSTSHSSYYAWRNGGYSIVLGTHDEI